MSEENDYFDDEFVVDDKKDTKQESADEKELRELDKVTINMKYNWLRTTAAVVGALLVIGAVLWVWMYFWVPVVSEQEQVGYIDEVRCEGRIFKTFEGKMLTVGMLYDSVPYITREFEFSIDYDSVARDLMRLQKTGHKVAITFKEFDTTLPWRGKSKRVVTTFEER